MNLRPKVNTYDNSDALSVALSAHVARLATAAATERGRFCIALSGGSLMEIIGPALGSTPLRNKIDGSTWHVFWTDERWVPLSHPDSNFRLAKQRLFNRVTVPDQQLHAVDDSLSPSETAIAYESTLAKVFQPGAGRMPRFDLVLLGVGEDGHTASLFPGQPALQETRRWVVSVADAPKPPPTRVTMTLPLINNARHVIFMAAGPGKAKIVTEMINPGKPTSELPVGRVHPSNGELQWFIDRAAAGEKRGP